MLRRAYMDSPCKNDSEVESSQWNSQMVKATNTDRGINDPTKKGNYTIFSVCF
ncbi:hypothetical protein DPMN_095187 [Dreissena polymorpha]|uniref:Uncharacterized protein n=1 Tax=Dreissena polymorpha TaxID=45954 RepID=A0A9D4R2M2_DREPO|nr:hypothetical protein DPMN_095187 [Dreissena polymorpha]